MNALLTVATILGGIAALCFFWDKLVPWLRPDLLRNPTPDAIQKVILASNPREDWAKVITNAKETLSYKGNPSLRFEMSSREDGTQNNNFQEPWANRHPDSHAYGLWCDLFFGPTHITRFILVGVDGMRALVPPPRSPSGDPGGLEIQPYDYRVAQIHDSLGTLDEYIRRSGLTVRKDAV